MEPQPQLAEPRDYFTVEEISQEIKLTLEEQYKFIRIKGEISGLIYHRSGHVYFSLKDSDCVIDAIAWKYVAQKFDIKLEDGIEIIGRGKITTYRGRSKYQFVMDSFELAGRGALFAILEKRRAQLEKEGLFDERHKKALPLYPQRIAIITSQDGAVFHDISRRLGERYFETATLFPAAVQGEGSAETLIEALQKADHLNFDVIIMARGGGSFEDLWHFNDERLCRAIFEAKTPIITAIGHEPDTPLVDYVSDKRAPTPTAAAEIVAPKVDDLQQRLEQQHIVLKKGLIHQLQEIWASFVEITQRLEMQKRLLDDVSHRLEKLHLGKALRDFITVKEQHLQQQVIHRNTVLNNVQQRQSHVSELALKMQNTLGSFLQKSQNTVQYAAQAIQPNRAGAMVEKRLQSFSAIAPRLWPITSTYLKSHESLLTSLSTQLRQNSLANILGRGYSVITDANGKVINSTADLKGGITNIHIHLSDGKLKGCFEEK